MKIFTSTLQMNSIVKNRIPSLDGLRAISVLLVIFSHAFHDIRNYVDLGNVGVRMFFIISSYLITGILYRDVISGNFSLKSFYFKRVMRTFPAFYFFIISIFIFLAFNGMFDWKQLWRAPVYLENYHARGDWNEIQWFVGHSWSLAVEEQFYILISLLFFIFNRGTITKNSLINLITAVLFIAPLFRLVYMRFDFFPAVFQQSVHRSFETVCDALAIGSIGYLLKDKIEKLLSKYSQIMTLVILVIIIIFISFFNGAYFRENFGYLPRYMYNSFGIFIINLAMLCIMFSAMIKPKDSVFTRMLNRKMLVFIGSLSYSIYLWQQPWLYAWDIPIYLKISGIFSCALISYYLIEEPFLRWRNNILNATETKQTHSA